MGDVGNVNMKKYNYENLEIYRLANNLVIEIYKITSKFPRSEIFGLVSQLRRAVVSVVLNIVEGSSRFAKKEFAIFIERSIGSLIEVRAGIQIAEKLGFIGKENMENIFNKIDELYFKTQKFKKYLRNQSL